MKNLLFIIAFGATVLTMPINAQGFTGIATYKSASKMTIKMDSSTVSAGEQELINQQLMKAMQKEYDLMFNAAESNWKEVDKLDNAGTASGGVEVIMIGSGGGNGLLYKNTKDKDTEAGERAWRVDSSRPIMQNVGRGKQTPLGRWEQGRRAQRIYERTPAPHPHQAHVFPGTA